MPRQQVIDYKYAGPAVDVWAMAACLYNMLTGAVPRDFLGKDPWGVVLHTRVVPIRQRAASIAPSLAKVIDQALDDNRDELYFQSAAALKQALEDTL